MEKIQFFRKRSGKLVKFNPEKIRSAIDRAIKEADALLPSPLDTTLSGFLTDKVLFLLDYEESNFYVKPDTVGSRIPKLESVQDAVEFAIQRRWEDRPRSFTDDKAKLLHDLYANYRKEREKARALLKVLNHKSEKMDVTDKSMLLLEGQRKNAVSGWDRNRLIQDLEKILPDADKAPVIAKRVERVILKSGLKTVSSDLIIEFVNNELMIEGIPTRMNSDRGYFIDKDFVDGLMYSKSKENSNIVGNNPEAINLALAEYTLKNWAFDNVFSEDVIHAHQFGQIYLHDLGYITRIYCSSHSIEYVKKYGLKGLINLNTVSKPAKSASVLTGHLNTYLASMQAYYAGALGLGYINVFYAPLVKGMTDEQIHQTAQELVFNGSQNAFSRGGQSLHPDELIWVKKNGRYQSMKIGEFVDSYIDNNPGAVRKTDNYEVFYTGLENIQAISFDKQTGKTLDKPIAYVARMPHKGKMYRVHTANGIVNVTGDHSLFTFKGKQNIVPTKASELKKKDFVVIPHRAHLEGEQEKVNILPYLPEEWLTVHGFDLFAEAVKKRGNPTKVLAEVGASRDIMKDGKKHDRVRFTLAKHFLDVNHCLIGIKGDSQAYMPAQIPLTWELGYVAGMFCSEGHQAHKKVMISNKDLNILGKVKSSLDVMDYKWYRHNEGMAMGMTTDQVEVNGILGAFLKMSCADGKKKIIPDWLYTAPEECIQGFMEGFYDGEGNNRKSLPNQWSVSNTSTRVVSGINLLLLREGRESYIYETKHNNSWSDVYEIREIRHRKVNPFQEYTTEEGYATYGSKLPASQIEAVEWLIKSDLSLSIIKKVEEYDYNGYVYDISVPGTEAFLGGIGNVFLKNTLFLDFNVHTGVPKTLKNIPAIGPGGKYMALNPSGNAVTLVERTVNGEHQLVDSTTGNDSDTVVLREKDGKGWSDEKEGWHVMRYGDYTEESQRFAKALLTVWGEGDANGHIFEFPKCDFHVSEETFSDPNEKEVYDYACKIASKNGSIYFVFDRDSVSVASCCFTGDTPVVTKGGKGSHVRLIPFKELAESSFKETRENLCVLHNGGWSRVKLVVVPGTDKPIYKIVTANNVEQKVTCDHIVPTLEGDKRADEVTENDYILFNTRTLPSARPNQTTQRKDLSYAQGILIGAYLGDGSIEQKGDWKPIVHFSLNKEKYEELMPNLEKALADWGIENQLILGDICNNVYPVRVNSRELGDAIREWVQGGHSHEKDLNLDCLKESVDFRKGILDGFYATDGGNANRIYTTSVSLVGKMEVLLTSLGLTSIIDKSDRTGKGQVEIRGVKYDRNYPLFCIRWYDSGTRRQYSDIYRTKNNSVYFKVSSVETLPEEEMVYCFQIEDDNEPYFTLPSGVITHNCRLRVKIDESLFNHPESIRSCGFQNVTINIPQASYRTKIEQGKGDPEVESETWKLFTNQIDAAMDLAVKAHLQKKKHIANLMSAPNMPLWQIGKPANDGKPYVDLEKCVYIIGLIGLDDACRYLFGKSMHEDEKLTTWGLSVIAHMNLRAKEYTKEHGITFTLEESPAESAARRLARSDLAHFPEQAKGIVNGSEGNEYYTNSVHIPAYANVSLVERIVRQAMFHGMIDSGAITHAFIGEETPSAGAISEIVERTFRETQSAQITFSPEFTYCMDCGYGTRGIKKTCEMCGSSNVEAETRVVGYFSRISQWNKSKQFGELVDRHRGNYAVEEAGK